jgi:hypothetical protein
MPSRLGLTAKAPMLSSTPRASPVGSRVPLALQAVFLNRAQEVNEPPPEAAMDFREPVYIYERVSQIVVLLVSE